MSLEQEADGPYPGDRDGASSKRKSQHNSRGHFSLPRLKKIKRDLLTDLPLDSHECQHDILSLVKKSFHFNVAVSCHEFHQVQAVHNPELTATYLDRRREMKSMGYPDALVTDTFAFMPVANPSLVDGLCRQGVRCGNQASSALGVSSMAVHLCKHADVLSPAKPCVGEKICLVVKLLKGKVKPVVCKNVGVTLEPTPNFDCHIAKVNVDQTAALPPHLLFYSSQLYVYEYGDMGVEDFPKQILPYAVVYYKTRDLLVPPRHIQSPNVPPPPEVSQSGIKTPVGKKGPANTVWRGRLHMKLTTGGQVYIDVTLLSHFVPWTVNLLSPLKIHQLYPEHNAQFTFFAGLTDLSRHPEVPWREHFFRSGLMRPRQNGSHFNALLSHIKAKREIPTVRLPNDVFLFLMPNCLLSSQLGLVQRDDDSPSLHCVLMSKFSTIEAEKKKIEKSIGKNIFSNYGSAKNWEDLFYDSENSDEEEKHQASGSVKGSHVSRSDLRTMFKEQRTIHNKFASMTLSDASLNFTPCACRSLSPSKMQRQEARDECVVRLYASMKAAMQLAQLHQNSELAKPHFPSGSRTRPRQHVSRKTRAMASFSPHASSSSSSDSDGEACQARQGQHLSSLHSTKSVQEELSEEDELTAQQMEDIILMRKPAVTVTARSKASSSLGLAKNISSSKLPEIAHRKPDNPFLLSKPKIIPTEPIPPKTQESPVAPISSQSNGSPTATPTAPTSVQRVPSSPMGPASPDVTNRKGSPFPSQTKIIPTEPASPQVPAFESAPVPRTITSRPASPEAAEAAALMDLSLPKIIPTEPKSPKLPRPQAIARPRVVLTEPASPDASVVLPVPAQPKAIPTEPVGEAEGLHHSQEDIVGWWGGGANDIRTGCESRYSPTDKAKDIRPSCESRDRYSPTDKSPHAASLCPPLPEDPLAMGDVDMRLPGPHSTCLHPSFGSQGAVTVSEPKPVSPNLAFGCWLPPGDLPSQPHSWTWPKPNGTSPRADNPDGLSTQSPPSPPSQSPPSPSSPPSPESTYLENDLEFPSPASPPPLESESPASPPMSNAFGQIRSTPVAIPTVRLLGNGHAPGRRRGHCVKAFGFRLEKDKVSVGRDEEVDSASDMNNFLNSASALDSDLDSSYEDAGS